MIIFFYYVFDCPSKFCHLIYNSLSPPIVSAHATISTHSLLPFVITSLHDILIYVSNSVVLKKLLRLCLYGKLWLDPSPLPSPPRTAVQHSCSIDILINSCEYNYEMCICANHFLCTFSIILYICVCFVCAWVFYYYKLFIVIISGSRKLESLNCYRGGCMKGTA